MQDGANWPLSPAYEGSRPNPDTLQKFEANLREVTLRFVGGAKPSDFSLRRNGLVLKPFTEADKDTDRTYSLWLEPGKWSVSLGDTQGVLDVQADCPEGLPIDPADGPLTLQCGQAVYPPLPQTFSLEFGAEWAPKIEHAAGGSEILGFRYRLAGAASFLSVRAALRFVPDIQGGSAGRVDELVGVAVSSSPSDLFSIGGFVDLSIWDVGPSYWGARIGGRLSLNASRFLAFLIEVAAEGYPESGSFAPIAETVGAGVAFNLGLR
jgi:hypothetical protein